MLTNPLKTIGFYPLQQGSILLPGLKHRYKMEKNREKVEKQFHSNLFLAGSRNFILFFCFRFTGNETSRVRVFTRGFT